MKSKSWGGWILRIGAGSTRSVQDHGPCTSHLCMKMWVPPLCFQWNISFRYGPGKINFVIQYVLLLLATIVHGFFSDWHSLFFLSILTMTHILFPMETGGCVYEHRFQTNIFIGVFPSRTKMPWIRSCSSRHGQSSKPPVRDFRRSVFWLWSMRCIMSSASLGIERSDDLCGWAKLHTLSIMHTFLSSFCART